MPTITRSLEFDAAHRVLGHEGKCANLHGHRYKAEIKVTGPRLDDKGRIVDFSVIKDKIGKWIDEKWDHNIILNRKDPLADIYFRSSESDVRDFFGPKNPFIMPPGANPTAEVMAAFLHNTANGLLVPLELGIQVESVRIYETPNCWADFPDHNT